MNFNVNTKTAACDLSRHQEYGGGSGCVSRFEVQFIPTSVPHQLESGLQKNWGLPARELWRRTWARALDLTSSHQRLLTIGFQNMDHSQNSTWSEPGVLNPQPSCFNGSHPTAQPRRTEALFWILLLVASTALACCSFYSARHRMAERSTSSWQRRQIAVPSFTLHSTATPKESRLFIYNLLWKSPALHCDK